MSVLAWILVTAAAILIMLAIGGAVQIYRRLMLDCGVLEPSTAPRDTAAGGPADADPPGARQAVSPRGG